MQLYFFGWVLFVNWLILVFFFHFAGGILGLFGTVFDF